MRYDDPALQDLLASEYVLGNLRGAARRRLVTLMREHAGLRRRVEHWEALMFPLIVRVPSVKAPQHLWQRIHARISPRAESSRMRRIWWTGFASACTLGALALALVFAFMPPRQPGFTMVAVLHDQHADVAILASWTRQQAAERQIVLQIVAHPDMPADTSWQAWLIQSGSAAPLSLGLLSAEPHQVLTISPDAARLLPRAAAIGISVEPKGGSQSGRPSGAYLFQGPALRVDG